MERTDAALKLMLQLQDEGLIGWPMDFEVMPPSEEAAAEALGYWFGEEIDWRAAGHRFTQFGRDGSGSLFCLWHVAGSEGEPPVVFFGSEGEKHLVAGNAVDFLCQWAGGMTFFDGAWLPPEAEDAHELDWDALRARVEQSFGAWTESADELAARAAEHPDFAAWVDGHWAE